MPVGAFDSGADVSGWFDATSSTNGWFDAGLIGTITAGSLAIADVGVFGIGVPASTAFDVTGDPLGWFDTDVIPAPAAGGVNGALAQTLSDATSSAAGAVRVTGAANDNLSGATAAGVGQVVVQGAATDTLADATSSATGAVAVHGAAAVTLGDATVSAGGAVKVQGASAGTLAGATAVGAGIVVVKGSESNTLADATSSSAGAVAVRGAAAQTLADAGASAAGAVRVAGALGATLDGATLAAHGGVPGATNNGALAVTLGDAAVTATATTYTRQKRGAVSSALGLGRPYIAVAGVTAHAPAVQASVSSARSVQALPLVTQVMGTLARATLGVEGSLPYINTHVTIPLTLAYQGTPFDPSSLTLTVVGPGLSRLTYTLISPEMQHPATGSYYVEIVPNKTGTWKYAWSALKADGRVFYDEDVIVVLPRSF